MGERGEARTGTRNLIDRSFAAGWSDLCVCSWLDVMERGSIEQPDRACVDAATACGWLGLRPILGLRDGVRGVASSIIPLFSLFGTV